MPAAFTITTHVLRPFCAMDESDRENFALFTIRAPAAQRLAQRATAVVLDVSGSMNDAAQGSTKLEWAKYAVRELVDLATPDDTLVLVAFASAARAIFGPARMDTVGKAAANRALDGVRASGGTYMSRGLEEAWRLLQPELAGRVGRIIFFTDGENDRADMRALDALLRDRFYESPVPLPVSTYGVGETYQEQLLHEIADRTGGNSRYVRDPQTLVDHLTQEFQQTQSIVFSGVMLHLAVVAGVEVGQIAQVFPVAIDLPATRLDARTVRVALPGFAPEEERQVLIGFTMPPQTMPGRKRAGFVQLTYDMPSEGVFARSERPEGGQIIVEYTRDAALTTKIDATVEHYADELRKADLVKQAVSMARTSRLSPDAAMRTGRLLDEARAVTGRLLAQAQARGDAAATAKLASDLAAIDQMQRELTQGEVSAGTRKLVDDQARGTTRLS